MSKPRLFKDYDKLDEQVKNLVHAKYPHGFEKGLISFFNAKGKQVSALPFETEKVYFLIKMTRTKAQQIHLARQEAKHDPKEVMDLDVKLAAKRKKASKRQQAEV